MFLVGFIFLNDVILRITPRVVGTQLVVFSYPESFYFQFRIPALLASCAPLASLLYWLYARRRTPRFSAPGYIACLAYSITTAALGVAAMLVYARLSFQELAAMTQTMGLANNSLSASLDNLPFFRWGFVASLVACGLAGAFFASRGPAEPPRNSS